MLFVAGDLFLLYFNNFCFIFVIYIKQNDLFSCDVIYSVTVSVYCLYKGEDVLS